MRLSAEALFRTIEPEEGRRERMGEGLWRDGGRAAIGVFLCREGERRWWYSL